MGIGDHDIEAAKCLFRFSEQATHCGRIHGIGLQYHRRAPGRVHCIRRRVRRRLVRDVVDDELRAFPRVRFSDCATDPT